MAWKTGRNQTVTANGIITGSISADVVYEQTNVVRDAKWSLTAFGLEAFGEIYTQRADPDDGDTNALDRYWRVWAGGPWPGAVQQLQLVHPPPLPADHFARDSYHYSLNIGGTVSVSVDVEEWMEVTSIPRSQADQDAGIIDAPARIGLRFYLATKPGGTKTITAISGGLTSSFSQTITSSVEVDYSMDLSVTADAAYCSQSVGLDVTVNGAPVNGGHSVSTNGGSFDDAGGVHISVSPPSPHTAVIGTTQANISPVKAFALNGVTYAVDQPYSGLVTYNCSRYQGDTAPTFAGGAGWGRSYSQRRSEFNAYLLFDSDPSPDYTYSDTIDEWQPVATTVDDSWCLANGEYVTGGGSGSNVYDDAVHLHGYTFDGIQLSQAPSLVLDSCTSATGWTGATTGGGGLQNTASSMVRTFSPVKNLSGYRYLRVRMQTDNASHPFTVNIGGKTWTRSATSAPMDFDLDLCCPDNATATSDLTDTRWPSADPSLGYEDGDSPAATDGPLSGIGYCGQITIGGLDSGVVYTLAGISQVRHTQATAHFLPTHAPRFGEDMLQEAPSATNESGTVTTPKVRRLLLADTDGRQSLEYRDIAVSQVVGGESDVTYYVIHYAGINDLSVYMPGGASSADTPYPAGQFPGWTATTLAPGDDSSQNVHNGYLNSGSPATWLMGGGLLYAGGAWKTGVGMDATNGLTVPAQMLFDSIEWYPGIGDVFGLGGGSSTSKDALILVAHKIFRAQSHGALLTTTNQPAVGQQVLLKPSGSTLQDNAVPVGWGKSGRPEGEYRTSGPSLIGYTAGSPSSGTVSAVGQIATQTYQTRHLSRVALRGTVTPDCCDQLFFQTPMLHDPLPELPGDSDALPVDEWRR